MTRRLFQKTGDSGFINKWLKAHIIFFIAGYVTGAAILLIKGYLYGYTSYGLFLNTPHWRPFSWSEYLWEIGGYNALYLVGIWAVLTAEGIVCTILILAKGIRNWKGI